MTTIRLTMTENQLAIIQLALVNIEENLEINREDYKKAKTKIDIALVKIRNK